MAGNGLGDLILNIARAAGTVQKISASSFIKNLPRAAQDDQVVEEVAKAIYEAAEQKPWAQLPSFDRTKWANAAKASILALHANIERKFQELHRKPGPPPGR